MKKQFPSQGTAAIFFKLLLPLSHLSSPLYFWLQFCQTFRRERSKPATSDADNRFFYRPRHTQNTPNNLPISISVEFRNTTEGIVCWNGKITGVRGDSMICSTGELCRKLPPSFSDGNHPLQSEFAVLALGEPGVSGNWSVVSVHLIAVKQTPQNLDF